MHSFCVAKCILLALWITIALFCKQSSSLNINKVTTMMKPMSPNSRKSIIWLDYCCFMHILGLIFNQWKVVNKMVSDCQCAVMAFFPGFGTFPQWNLKYSSYNCITQSRISLKFYANCFNFLHFQRLQEKFDKFLYLPICS